MVLSSVSSAMSISFCSLLINSSSHFSGPTSVSVRFGHCYQHAPRARVGTPAMGHQHVVQKQHVACGPIKLHGLFRVGLSDFCQRTILDCAAIAVTRLARQSCFAERLLQSVTHVYL